jgi:hypothetical protein
MKLTVLLLIEMLILFGMLKTTFDDVDDVLELTIWFYLNLKQKELLFIEERQSYS